MKNQQGQSVIETIVYRQRERRRRLEAAHAAEQSLLSNEREEFLAALYEKLEQARPDSPRVRRVPRVGLRTIRTVIAEVLSSGIALGSSDICRIAVERDPSLRKASVASELTQMRKVGLVVRMGSGPRGGLYGLARRPANEVAAQRT